MSIPHRTDLPPVETHDDLTDRWRLLAADDCPRLPSQADLWVQSFDDEGLQCSPLLVVEGVPVHPDPAFTANLAGVLEHLLEAETGGTGAVAFAICRHRPVDVHAADLQWAEELTSACAVEDVPVLGVHLVTGREVRWVA